MMMRVQCRELQFHIHHWFVVVVGNIIIGRIIAMMIVVVVGGIGRDGEGLVAPPRAQGSGGPGSG